MKSLSFKTIFRASFQQFPVIRSPCDRSDPALLANKALMDES